MYSARSTRSAIQMYTHGIETHVYERTKCARCAHMQCTRDDHDACDHHAVLAAMRRPLSQGCRLHSGDVSSLWIHGMVRTPTRTVRTRHMLILAAEPHTHKSCETLAITSPLHFGRTSGPWLYLLG